MKPIVVLFLNKVTEEQKARLFNMIPVSLKEEYHVLILTGCERVDVKVFFENELVDLDQQKLEELLALSKV
jgi:hypothetical protein